MRFRWTIPEAPSMVGSFRDSRVLPHSPAYLAATRWPTATSPSLEFPSIAVSRTGPARDSGLLPYAMARGCYDPITRT